MKPTCISVDLGQKKDPTALALIVREGDFFDVREIFRFPLRTAYTTIAERVKGFMEKAAREGGAAPNERPSLVLDGTGVGVAVVDIFRKAGLSPISITITGAGARAKIPSWIDSSDVGSVNAQGAEWTASKLDLIGVLEGVMEKHLLRIADDIPELPMLNQELNNFKTKKTPSGNDTLEAWRAGVHDDMVLAIALGVYYLSLQGEKTVPIRYAGGCGPASPETDRLGRPLPTIFGKDVPPGLPLLGHEPWISIVGESAVTLDANGDVVRVPGRHHLPGLK